MPSPTIILVILLAISAAGNALLGKLYVEAHADYEVEKDRYVSFEKGVELAAAKQAKDSKDKDDQAKKDKENSDKARDAKYAKYESDLGKLRSDAAKRDSRGGSMSQTPANSKCPEGQVCFDKPEYQRAIGEFDTATRSIADFCSKVAIDLNEGIKWANAPPMP